MNCCCHEDPELVIQIKLTCQLLSGLVQVEREAASKCSGTLGGSLFYKVVKEGNY